MKKYIFKAGLVVISMLAFAGCAGVSPGTAVIPDKVEQKSGMNYKILKTSDNDYMVYPSIVGKNGIENKNKFTRLRAGFDRKSPQAAKVKRKVYSALFKAAAEGTRALGYNYFVLTNVEVNGFSGFPINNFKDFMRFVTLEDRKHTFDTLGEGVPDYRGLVNTRGVTHLRFKPVSKSVYDTGAIAVWKTSDFI